MALFKQKSFFKNRPYRVPGTLPLPFAAVIDRYVKRRYAFPAENRLGRKRIFILPAYFGFLFALAIIVMLLGALNYNNSPAFMITFLLMAIGLVTPLHTYRNLSQLSFRPIKTIPAFAGHPVQYWVLIDNKGGKQRFAIELYAADQAAIVVDIPANGTSTVHLNLPTHKRGKIPYCVVSVQSRYPFGLYRAWAYIRIDASCLVYPKPSGNNSQPLPSPNVHGDKESRQIGTEDYIGLRNYHAGDSIKHIYWKAYARGQPLLTKQFSLSESDEIWFDWDMLQTLNTETRLSQLTRWILDAEQRNDSYGLIIPNTRIEPSQGEQHKSLCLKALALYRG